MTFADYLTNFVDGYQPVKRQGPPGGAPPQAQPGSQFQHKHHQHHAGVEGCKMCFDMTHLHSHNFDADPHSLHPHGPPPPQHGHHGHSGHHHPGAPMTPPHQHGSRPHGPHGSPPPHGHHGHHHPGAPMTPPHGSHGSHGSHSHHGHTHHAHHGHHHSGAPVTPPPKMAHIPYMRRVYPGNIMELNTERPKYKDHVPPKFITEQVRVMETFEGYSFRIEGISAQVFGSSELHHSPKQMQDVPQIVFDVYKAEHVRFAAWGVEHSPASIPGCDCEHCIKKVALMADLKLKRKVNVNGAHSHYDGKALIVFLPYL